MSRIGRGSVQSLPQRFGNLRRVHRAALAAFDFDGGYTDFDEFGQHFQNIQTGRLFQCVISFVVHLETAFTQGRIACRFVRLVLVD